MRPEKKDVLSNKEKKGGREGEKKEENYRPIFFMKDDTSPRKL